MYTEFRSEIFAHYNSARDYFIQNPDKLIALEHYTMSICHKLILENYSEFEEDYNEANYLHPFWANYPPDDRGRAPVGDQVPWIEVGEHAIGSKLERFFSYDFDIREVGIPSGADNRFVFSSQEISDITSGFTNSIMAFIDIKSVGPRDDFEHTVISPYQVSGDGVWNNVNDSLVNSPMMAIGKIAQHPFYPAITPIYVLSDGTIAPTVHIFIKPVYKMLSLAYPPRKGQPLSHIRVVCVPNGLLLTISPNYLRKYPGLFFPGKDDKSKQPAKVRCRVSFDLLKRIAPWRVIEGAD